MFSNTIAPPSTADRALASPLSAHWGELADLLRRLREPPYYGVVPHDARWLREAGVEQVMRALATMPAGLPVPSPSKLSFTRVQVDPAAASRSGGTTHYSRTHLPLALHTDSSNMADPHQLIAFHMVRSDAVGGDSTMLPLPRLLDALPAGLADALATPFPFGRLALPVLWGPGPNIRYYRAQIDTASAGQLPAVYQSVLDEFDRVLDRPGLIDRFGLAEGDVLFINNRRALHGRTGFSPTSGRLMLRYRIHASSLD